MSKIAYNVNNRIFIQAGIVALLIEGNKGDKIEEVLVKQSLPSDTKKFYKFLVKADALRINNMFQESVKHYLKALMLERKNIQIYIGLAQSYMHLDNVDKAVETLEKARTIEPNNADISFEIGKCFMRMGLPCVAAVSLKETILLDKNNLEAQIQLGVAHELMDETEMALKIYQRIMEKHPSFLKAYQHKAALLVELQLYQQAAAVFGELLKINPQYYKAVLGIGICFDKLGKTSSAIRYYKKFLQLKPNSKNAPDVVSRLEQIKKGRVVSANNFLKLA